MRELSVETTTHGRVLVEDASGNEAGLVVAFHGYAQNAEDMLAQIARIPGAARWRLASVQGLHRFYTRSDERVVASWMTRQDRETAAADNVAYVDRVIARLTETSRANPRVVLVGFSQGAAMAYRAAGLGRSAIAGLLALAGDIPPEVKSAPPGRTWPPVLIGVGDRETWYTPPKVDVDLAFLRSRGIRHEIVRFTGGHEWTDDFRRAAGDWLARIAEHRP